MDSTLVNLAFNWPPDGIPEDLAAFGKISSKVLINSSLAKVKESEATFSINKGNKKNYSVGNFRSVNSTW